MLQKAAGQQFYNTSKYDFERLKGESEDIAPNLLHYIHGFSPEVRALFEHFAFDQQIQKGSIRCPRDGTSSIANFTKNGRRLLAQTILTTIFPSMSGEGRRVYGKGLSCGFRVHDATACGRIADAAEPLVHGLDGERGSGAGTSCGSACGEVASRLSRAITARGRVGALRSTAIVILAARQPPLPVSIPLFDRHLQPHLDQMQHVPIDDSPSHTLQ